VKLIDLFKRNKKTTLALGLVLALAAAYLFAFPRSGVAAETAYQTETVARGDLSAVVGATGTVRAAQAVTLAWQTSGIVESVEAQLGDRVQAGELLAVLERASLPKEVVLAEANLVSAQQALDDLIGSADTDKANAAIALREAQEAYEQAVNYRELLDDQVEYDLMVGFKGLKTPMGYLKIPNIKHIEYSEQPAEGRSGQDVALRQAELEDAGRAYEHLQDGPNPQDLAATEARVAAAQAALDQAKLSAPFEGVITDISIQPGDWVTAGEAAFRVEDLSGLLIDLEVSEVDINSVSLGQVVTVNFDAIQGKDYQGLVVEIAGTGRPSAGSVNFRVTVELADADELVKPGMTAAVLIRARTVEDALLVPNRAVREVGGQRIVYVLREDDSLEAMEVRLGTISDAYSEVVGGDLQAGDRVVLNPPAVVNNAFDSQ
jgi:HlyD family secretion protein